MCRPHVAAGRLAHILVGEPVNHFAGICGRFVHILIGEPVTTSPGYALADAPLT